MSGFIFICIPQILHCFLYRVLSPDYWVWVRSLRYFQPTKPGQPLLFCSFTVLLASASVRPQVNKSKPKKNHNDTFHFDVIFFCFPLHTYLVFVWFSVPFWLPPYMGSPTGFSQTPSLKRHFPIFHSRTSPFCCHQFFSLESSKLFQSKFISFAPGRQSQTARLELQLDTY